MNNIEIIATLKYTKELSLLYVEDDINLQIQTQKLFESLFKSVSVRSCGKEALDLYMNNEYDIVITDVKMPNMDGVALVREIRKIKKQQEIIITSAYNDSDNLISFINLNVSNFIFKPINTQDFITIIHNVAKNIANIKMLELYRKDLEFTNVSLKEKNDEFKSLLRIFNFKLVQFSKLEKKENINKKFDKTIMSILHLEELKELEIDIIGAYTIINLSRNITASNIQVLAKMFATYSAIITQYSDYHELQEKIQLLSNALHHGAKNFIKKVDEITILLESFIYVLRMWSEKLLKHEVEKAFELHASMINDISSIVTIIDNTENKTINGL